MAIAIVLTSLALIVVIILLLRLKKGFNPLDQNNKAEPLGKHDYIFRKHLTKHQGIHPHIVYDKYTDGKGKKRFKAVALSHEWKRRRQKNPFELKKDINPEDRNNKAFVIHEIIDDDAKKFQKSSKYVNYSVHPRDRKRLGRTIDRWEKEPKDYTEPFPKDKRTREIIRRQKEAAKQKAIMKKQEKEDASKRKGA